jgi:hypothetical protein
MIVGAKGVPRNLSETKVFIPIVELLIDLIVHCQDIRSLRKVVNIAVIIGVYQSLFQCIVVVKEAEAVCYRIIKIICFIFSDIA